MVCHPSTWDSTDQCNSTVSHPTFPSCTEIPASFFQLLVEPFELCQNQIFHTARILRSKTRKKKAKG